MDRKLPQRKRLRLPKYDYSQPGYYFITVCTRERKQEVLCSIEPAVGAAALGGPVVVLTPYGKIVDQLIRNIDFVYHGTISVDTYCMMPDHVHLILTIRSGMDGPPRAAAPTDVPAVINALKSLSAKKIRTPIWQRGYYDHVIRNDADLAAIRQYIRSNPLKWIQDKD